MKDINRIRISKKQVLPNILSRGDMQYVDLPNTGGVPDGVRDVTHPSVIYFPDGWNGYTHWMVATPWAQNSALGGNYYENPCIYYANGDAENKHPTEFTPIANNPIVGTPRNGGGEVNGNNSDPDIFFAEGRLWVVGRVQRAGRPSWQIYILSSENGVDWTETTEIYAEDMDGGNLCPMYTYENGKHRIYLIQSYRNPAEENADDRVRTDYITVLESDSLLEPNFVEVGYGAVEGLANVWHGSMFLHNDIKYLIGAGQHEGDFDKTPGLFLARQIDGTEDIKFYNTPLLSRFGAYRAHGFVDDEGMLVSYTSVHNRNLLTPNFTPHGDEFDVGNFVMKVEVPMDELIEKLESYELNSV